MGWWVKREIEIPKRRLENERDQLVAMRDDANACRRGGALWLWLNGAIYTLTWILGERGARAPSWGANFARTRMGREDATATTETATPPGLEPRRDR